MLVNIHFQPSKSMCVYAKSLQSCLTLCNPMAYSPPGSSAMGFSKLAYSSGLPCPPPGDLPNPGIEPMSLTSPALAGGFFTTSTTWEAHLRVQLLVLQNWCPLNRIL